MAYRRIPSLNWLRVFEAAARFQSFARAAEVLNMSPAAVSQQIRALEGALGSALFERQARSVTLTEAGRAFLPTVAQALNTVELSATSLFGETGRAALVLRVSSMLACSWLAPRLPDFERAHPGVQLSIESAVGDDDFDRRGPEMQITFGLPPRAGEEGDELFGETIYPVATPDVAARISRPADLLDHRLIEIATHRANWQMLLARAGLGGESRPQVTYTDTTQIAMALAAAGGGIALARAPASDGIEALYGLAPCLSGFSIPGLQRYYLTYASRETLSPAARAFRAWLLQQAEPSIRGIASSGGRP